MKNTPAKTETKATKRSLPEGVRESDLKQPHWERALPWRQSEELGLVGGRLEFYRTDKTGWLVLTLHISNPPRRHAAGTPARFYATAVKDKTVHTVGMGPHVLEQLTVYVTQDNLERLMPLIELHKQGLVDANTIRDRISSRRAQGQLRRQAFGGLW